MNEVLKALEWGPLTGRELYEITGLEVFPLWRFCKRSKDVITRRVSKRYLRFDREIEGYARLSPSVQREFLTYTVVGLKSHREKVEERAKELKAEIRKTSREKLTLAGKIAWRIVSRMQGKNFILTNSCFIIGGDVPLGMAHSDPRPEPSTGKLVSGSDLDIVVVTTSDFPPGLARQLDEEIYREKYRLLRGPHYRVEIDYLIKDLEKVKRQAALQRFEDYIACKIIMESKLLLGSKKLYQMMRGIMHEASVPKKLEHLKKLAAENRRRAERTLLNKDRIMDEDMRLFATSEEYGEIF